MRQRMTDRWVEAAEARRVCEWAMAEQPPRPEPAHSLIAKLNDLFKLEAGQLSPGAGPVGAPGGVTGKDPLLVLRPIGRQLCGRWRRTASGLVESAPM